MFSSTADILNISLAVGFALLVVFVCVALWHLIFVLRDLADTMRVVRRVAEQIDELILRPMTFVGMLLGQLGSVLDVLGAATGSKKKKR